VICAVSCVWPRDKGRWPEELAVEQEVIEPEEVKDIPEAFRCIGKEVTEMLEPESKRSVQESFFTTFPVVHHDVYKNTGLKLAYQI
jgi:hypothetical protein